MADDYLEAAGFCKLRGLLTLVSLTDDQVDRHNYK